MSQKIIYFDQNAWIDLAKIYYGSPSETESELLSKIVSASESERALFPLSMVHLEETSKIRKERWRSELASLMAKISKGYSVTPYWPRIIELEIENVVRETIGAPVIDVRKYWLGKGLSRLMGMKPSIADDGTLTKEEYDKFSRLLEESLLDPKSFEILLSHPIEIPSLEQDAKESIEVFEKNREGLQEFKDKDFRFRVFLGRNTLATIGPRISKILMNYRLSPKLLDIILPPNGFNEFLRRIPTALCEFYLLYYRDQQLQRPIQVNDSTDIWHLTLGIPYSDIVVTENMWTSICTQSKLDTTCDTVVINSISKLNQYL